VNPDVFHITHINNLNSVILHGGLCSDSQRITQNLANENIGYSHIKLRRLNRPVIVSNKGYIGDYVPFNFCPRSVMLFVVNKGHEDYQGGQNDVLHLVTDVNSVRQLNQFCFFTDIHADLGYAEQIDDFSRLNEVNWTSVNQHYWSSVKEEKQAEFLAFRNVPWTAIKEIGVKDLTVAARVQQLIATSAHQPLVKVKAQWYY
jgi:hypothetical protein